MGEMLTREEFLEGFNLVSSTFPENIAFCYVCESEGSLGVNYFELNRLTNQLSEYFLKLFGKNTQYIGVIFRSAFLLPCFTLGIWKSRHCFAGVDDRLPPFMIVKFLDSLRIKYLITDSSRLPFSAERINYFTVNGRLFYIWKRELPSEALLDGLEEMCYGIMTSGTTGEPKIIQVPWSCILTNAVELSEVLQMTELDCIFQSTPYYFDPFFIEIFLTFLKGGSLLITSKIRKLYPSYLLKMLFNNNVNEKLKSGIKKRLTLQTWTKFHFKVQPSQKIVTFLQMTPSIFKRWSESEIQYILSPNSPLRILLLGGEKFPREILKLKCPGNKTKVFNIYGITEISCWAFLNDVTNSSPDAQVSLGKPLSDIVYQILENGELEIGSSKRICVINEEKIHKIENPVFRKTGDIVQFVNENIYYVGRSNQEVKKYGIKINLSRIEDLFVNKNKLMKKCYCVFNENNSKLGLFYVPVTAGSEDIKMRCRIITFQEFKEKYIYPTYELKYIERPDSIFEISKTPLNSNGKCDRLKLEGYLNRIVTTGSDLKLIFKHLWIDVLNIKKIGFLSSSFIELGGNSVLALSLVDKLKDQGVNVPPNFITALLGRKGYAECLQILDEYKVFRKDIKLNVTKGDILFEFFVCWKFDLGKCVDATPAIFRHNREERIVVGSHSSKLSCLKSDSGEEVWTVRLGDRIESGFTPNLSGTKGYVGCYDHCIYCISTSNGSTIWKFETEDMVKSTPCLSTNEDIVFVGSYDKKLYCLSAVEGKVISSLQLSNGGIYCSGIVGRALNSFFIGTLDGTCAAINQKTNKLVWKTVLSSPVFASPCLIPGKSEIIFSEVLGSVHILNALDGTKMRVFNADGNIYSSAVVDVDANLYFFGCHDENLYCLEYVDDIQLKWKQLLDSAIFAKPVILGDSVCCVTKKGFIYLCECTSGSIERALKLGGEVFSSPIRSGDQLFVGCRDNNVYSFKFVSLI